MNKVTCKSEETKSYNTGDIFKSGKGEKYILTRVSFRYNEMIHYRFICVSLADGLAWEHPTETIKDAINGLTLAYQNANIQIS